MTKKRNTKTGPKPDRLPIEGDWISAVGKAINKERPEDGWPEPEKKEKDKEK